MSSDALVYILFGSLTIFTNLAVLAFNLKLYTEIMKEKSQRGRKGRVE